MKDPKVKVGDEAIITFKDHCSGTHPQSLMNIEGRGKIIKITKEEVQLAWFMPVQEEIEKSEDSVQILCIIRNAITNVRILK